VQGLMIPYVYETAVEGIPQTEKITIVNVVLNPELDDSLFEKFE
jgi:outer membrane lipoprotein-sorting protein